MSDEEMNKKEEREGGQVAAACADERFIDKSSAGSNQTLISEKKEDGHTNQLVYDHDLFMFRQNTIFDNRFVVPDQPIKFQVIAPPPRAPKK